MASALNVAALSDYVNVHKDELLVKSAVGAQTLGEIEIMPNVKYKDAILALDTTVVLADGEACGFNPQGADAFSEKYIEVKPIKIEKEWCAKDMRKKALNHELMIEAGRATLPVEEYILNSNVEAVKAEVEKALWGGVASLNIDGFVALADAAGNTVTKGATTTATVDALVAALPIEAVAKGVKIFMSYTTFRDYVAEQNAYCCATRPIVDAAAKKLAYLGDSRVEIIPTMGLEGQNRIIATSNDNLVYGTDVEGSEAVFRFWFDEKDEMFRMRILFNFGVAVKYDAELFEVQL